METIIENPIRNRKANNKIKESVKINGENSELTPKVSKIKNEKNERLDPISSDEPNLKTKKKNEDKQIVLKVNESPLIEDNRFVINVSLDLMSLCLFIIAILTRVYRLAEPRSVVFDEIHFAKYISLYIRNIFYFDQHPPLGKQLIAGVAQFSGYNGNATFPRIGADYSRNVPIFWLRIVPAICGSLLPSVIYKLLVEVKLNRWTCALGGFLIVFDNALLTQSRFILMDSILLLFSSLGILYLMKFLRSSSFGPKWWAFGVMSATCLASAVSVKYVGIYTWVLAFIIICRHLWKLLPQKTISNYHIIAKVITKFVVFAAIAAAIYLGSFYVHLSVLYKAGPHDNAMTSAFQASLKGGLASITKGQPLLIQHGSQITLRHTHGRVCWLHSHLHVYPLRYTDDRGSSHQQQVSCYSFKDVNNWWIVKRPEKDHLNVDDTDYIKHGDEIQLVHGITSRALNSHDVAAPVSPLSQEVSCYIDYNVSMAGNLVWRVDLINKVQTKNHWHAISSEIRLIHVHTGVALKFSGQQLPDWGFNQHEIVGDRVIAQSDTVWNVEEHRYTHTTDKKERHRELLNAEMIPTEPTKLTFFSKFMELQHKMFINIDSQQSHMYSSTPSEWPLLHKGIAYWIDKRSNAQVHLLGNIVIWYTSSIGLVTYVSFLIFYLVRRRRLCYDLSEPEWIKFESVGELFLTGYLIHYLPYFFYERTLFLYNYFPALIYKILLLCFVLEHIHVVIKKFIRFRFVLYLYKLMLIAWLASILYFFAKFSVLSYGTKKITANDIASLRLKDSWDFIMHRNLQ